MSSSAAMEAIDELVQLSESMRQAASLLADDDPSDETASRRPSTFLNAVALGNVVSAHRPLLELDPSRLPRFPIWLNPFCSRSVQGAGKSAVLNSLIGHPVLVSASRLTGFLLLWAFAYVILWLLWCCSPRGKTARRGRR
jgi:dynamin 1/3